MVIYYTFTSLSTIGFGDIYPQNNFERIMACFVLLFGVATFTYIIDNQTQIFDKAIEFSSPLGEDA